MVKKVVLAVFAVAVVVGALAAVKFMQIKSMINMAKHFTPPPEAVTTAVAKSDSWDTLLTAVGSVEAVQGVTVAAELSGKVDRIAFEAGSTVNTGDLLVQQDISSEQAQLRAAEATVALAKIDLDRATNLLASKTISPSEFDDRNAKYKEAVANADNIRATIAKKTITAPFAGRLGLRQVNVGQILKEGQAIVTLQTLDPIYVNFRLPQQQLAQVSPGLTVRVTSDALPGETMQGKITAISPEVDPATRNVEIQATLGNPQYHLRPGMFVNVAVVLPAKERVIAIPATAVLYAPYSNSVYVVESKKVSEDDAPTTTVRQQFVQLGENRGDYVAVDSGLKAGQTVVSTGVFKLRNGQAIVVNNSLSPKFKLNPNPVEE